LQAQLEHDFEMALKGAPGVLLPLPDGVIESASHSPEEWDSVFKVSGVTHSDLLAMLGAAEALVSISERELSTWVTSIETRGVNVELDSREFVRKSLAP
jgi:hypothetical protein